MNAALMAQGDYALTRELWETIRVDQVIDGGIDLDLSIEAMFGQLRRLGPFLKKYIGSRGADITPLIGLVKRVIDEEKVRASGIRLGVTAVSFPSLKPLEITLEQMPAGTLHDYLLASAACFPAFPMMKAEGRSYIDGGYYDNLPIDLAVKMGRRKLLRWISPANRSIRDTGYAVCHLYPALLAAGFFSGFRAGRYAAQSEAGIFGCAARVRQGFRVSVCI
ncbi:MAG: patatin-like phospholipase family protein [Oscillospiraceae bacterium]